MLDAWSKSIRRPFLLASAPGGWAPAASVTVLALLALALIHHETALSIAHIWSTADTFAHGWLILPLSAWIVWRNRHHLATLEPRVSWRALSVVAVLELLWITAAIADVQFVMQLALVALIPATVLVLLGPRVTRALAFPLAYLVFAVPWGEGLVPMLQDVTAWMSVGLLKLSGIPVFWEGRVISTPVADFAVAEACSGVRYLIASLAMGALYAHLCYRSNRRKIAFVLASIAMPIMANGLRAYGIIMLAYLSDMELAVGVDHLIYGWLFFVAVLFLLFWLGSFWWDSDEHSVATNKHGVATSIHGTPLTGLACACAAIVAITFTASFVPAWSAQAQPVPATVVSLPDASGGWSMVERDAMIRPSGFSGADEVRRAHYESAGGDWVGLLVVHYRREAQGEELVNAQNTLRGDDWRWIAERRRQLAVGNGARTVRELELGRGARRQMVWTWYDVGGWQTAYPPVAKAVAAGLRMGLQRGDATLVALATDHDGDTEKARTRLQAFLRAHPEVLMPRGLIREQ